MISRFIGLIQKPFRGLLFLSIIFIFLPLLITNYLGRGSNDKIVIFLITFVIIIVLSELLFRFFYRLYFGAKYNFIKKMPFDKIRIEPHPYLPYILKKKLPPVSSEKMNYPLNSSFYSAEVKTNNLRFVNGTNGDRDVVIPKPKNLYRINCIGGSTTQNYFKVNNENFSYPLELEKILKSKFNKQIEVNNCGVGGYNSADLLIRFALQIIDTQPDLIVIYHGYNDIKSYITPDFSSDYSHSRKNIGEIYWKLSMGSKIPDIPLKFMNYLTNKWFPERNIRHSLLEVVSKGKIDSKISFAEGLKVYERNLQNIINLCLSNNIEVVLCTFCFYLHKKIKNNSLNILYEKITIEENKIIEKLAKKNNLKLVDCYSTIPKEESNFVDHIHFSPEGMKLLAKSIADKIQI